MATFRKRSGKWNVRIQRQGYPEISKTFATQADAKAWAKRIEVEIDLGCFVDRTEAENNTLGDILERYKREISPKKKAGNVEITRIDRFIRAESLCSYKAAALTLRGKANLCRLGRRSDRPAERQGRIGKFLQDRLASDNNELFFKRDGRGRADHVFELFAFHDLRKLQRS